MDLELAGYVSRIKSGPMEYDRRILMLGDSATDL
jgi:hypothetical protein